MNSWVYFQMRNNKNEAAKNKIMDFQAENFLYNAIINQVLMLLKFLKIFYFLL